MLVSTKPHLVAVFRQGYARVSLSNFSLDNLDDRRVRRSVSGACARRPARISFLRHQMLRAPGRSGRRARCGGEITTLSFKQMPWGRACTNDV